MTGTQVGAYRITRQLGAGGMGAVYEAVHESIGRRVAIKVLHAQYLGNEQIARRFLNEARAVNLVEHPGIVQISEVGRLPDGAAYLIMEFLNGETLSTRIARLGRMNPPDAARLVRQIAAPLQVAHDKGIIHRDLKPDNVMMVPDPDVIGGERPKVLDFGIAKLAADLSLGGEHAKTQTGTMMGTPLYMAPEQCRGAGLVDEKADVYSLGVMLFQMLSGRPPFWAEGGGAIMGMHMYEAPPSLAAMAPGTPDRLCGLVHRMLAKPPAQRPSLTEVMAEIDAYQQQLPFPSAAPPPPTYDQRPGARSVTPTLSPHPSTLGQANGQPTRGTPRRQSWAAAGGVLMAMAILGAGAARLLNNDPHHTATQRQVEGAQTTPRAPIHWQVTSEPPGAQVIRESDGAPIGLTPWLLEAPPGSGPEALTLRRAGYLDRRLTLDRGKSEARTEVLERAAAPVEQAHPGSADTGAPPETPGQETPSLQTGPTQPAGAGSQETRTGKGQKADNRTGHREHKDVANEKMRLVD